MKKQTSRSRWDAKTIIAAVEQFVQEQERLPAAREMKYYNGLPVHKTFERIMGQTWGSYARLHYPQLVESAKARHQQRVLDVRREQYEWTKEKLIFAVKGFVQQNGRLPLMQEYTIENGLPSYTTFCKIAEQAMVGYLENCFVGHIYQSDVLKENDVEVCQEESSSFGMNLTL